MKPSNLSRIKCEVSSQKVSGNFWENRSVLVTGHTGFKGSWLCLWLERLGARVVGYALEPPTQPNLYQLANLHTGIQSIIDDIRHMERLETTIRETKPEIILHLAAQSIVRLSYEDPLETYSTNVQGTACVLEAVRRAGRPLNVLNITTDKCYKNHEWLWAYRENDELGGYDPYSNSKACSELLTQAFRDSFFPVSKYKEHNVAIATARAGNVIGGGDWTTDQLVPDILRAFDEGRPVLIRSPDAVRPWQHVLDCLSGYIRLAEALSRNGPEVSGAYNFGPERSDAKPVSWIVEFMAGLWGEGARWKIDGREHPHEAGMLSLDSSKARSSLRWQPKLDLPTALEWTAQWYRQFFAGSDARELCLSQIERYMGLNTDHG